MVPSFLSQLNCWACLWPGFDNQATGWSQCQILRVIMDVWFLHEDLRMSACFLGTMCGHFRFIWRWDRSVYSALSYFRIAGYQESSIAFSRGGCTLRRDVTSLWSYSQCRRYFCAVFIWDTSKDLCWRLHDYLRLQAYDFITGIGTWYSVIATINTTLRIYPGSNLAVSYRGSLLYLLALSWSIHVSGSIFVVLVVDPRRLSCSEPLIWPSDWRVCCTIKL